MRGKKIISTLIVATLLGSLTACSSNEGSKESNVGGSKTNSKKEFIIYNCAGATEYHNTVVVEEFKKLYGDKYDIKYEDLSAADVISKIEAQGFEKGKGNVNIVIMGDSDVPKGLKAGIFSELSDYEEELNIDELEDIPLRNYNDLDKSALPIMTGVGRPGIAYMPDTEVGARLDALVGDDGEITYEELKDFTLNDEAGVKMGRGRIGNSGPGDSWTWGVLQSQGEYAVSEVPQKSIDWTKEFYEGGHVSIYDSTSATFKDLTEGSVDYIPHSLGWYYRLYALGKANDTLPENLKVDSFGLENSKFALMTGDGVDDLAGGHFYMIPSNLSDEDFEASIEYLKMASTPEINSQTYTSLMQPSYKYSSITKVTNEDILTVWNEVSKYYPERYLVEKDGVKQLGVEDASKVGDGVKDVNLITIYSTAWKDQLESNMK